MAAADYISIEAAWPRDMQKLMSMARRHFSADIWKSFSVTGDPETIIEEAAQKKLLLDAGRKYDVQVVSALISTINKSKKISPVYVIDLQGLKAGMILMEDLKHKDGRLLLNQGTKLRSSTIQSIQSVGERGLIKGKVSICLQDDEQV
jgi:hypothetical protein